MTYPPHRPWLLLSLALLACKDGGTPALQASKARLRSSQGRCGG